MCVSRRRLSLFGYFLSHTKYIHTNTFNHTHKLKLHSHHFHDCYQLFYSWNYNQVQDRKVKIFKLINECKYVVARSFCCWSCCLLLMFSLQYEFFCIIVVGLYVCVEFCLQLINLTGCILLN